MIASFFLFLMRSLVIFRPLVVYLVLQVSLCISMLLGMCAKFLLCRCFGLFRAHFASFCFIFLYYYMSFFCITICHLLALLPSFRD